MSSLGKLPNPILFGVVFLLGIVSASLIFMWMEDQPLEVPAQETDQVHGGSAYEPGLFAHLADLRQDELAGQAGSAVQEPGLLDDAVPESWRMLPVVVPYESVNGTVYVTVWSTDEVQIDLTPTGGVGQAQADRIYADWAAAQGWGPVDGPQWHEPRPAPDSDDN